MNLVIRPLLLLLAGGFLNLCVGAESEVTHSFLATGAETRIVSSEGKTLWSDPRGTALR